MGSGERQEDVVFVGDVHLGRRPVGLDEALHVLGLRAADLSPAVALARTVDDALEHGARAVVFAGDLVESEVDQFEARSVLEREVRRLADAGVPVLAVAGNHDSLVLPRVVEEVAGARLLGARGTWECVPLEGPGSPVDLVGWSFPKRHVTTCPLDVGDLAGALGQARPGAARLGVLHGDLDQAGSHYAPVPRARLEATGLDAWFLGHVHAPGDLTAPRPIGYLGSLVGLDPGEPGPRGPWRVHAGPEGLRCRQLALGPVRWEQVAVELAGDDAIDEQAVLSRVRAELDATFAADPTLDPASCDLVVARVVLSGSPSRRTGARALADAVAREPQALDAAGLRVVLEKVHDATRAPVDLAALAEQPTPLGRVAARLLALQAGQADELVARAARAVARVRDGGWHLDDEDHPLPPTEALLERAAWRVLHAMLEQREEARGA